jgi:DNA primase
VDGDEPKYYTANGMKKSHALYGLHRVSAEGPVVIVEGPTDVWRVGENAVALFGKTASREQIHLIQTHFAGRPLVVMLDADAGMDANLIVERLYSCRHGSLFKTDWSPVVRAFLPPDRDPGDCSPREIQQAIKYAFKTAHVK